MPAWKSHHEGRDGGSTKSIAQSLDLGLQVFDPGLCRNPQGMLDIGFPRCFGSGELGGGELGAQIINLALECPPIGHLPFDHSLQRGQNSPQNRNKSLRVQGTGRRLRRLSRDDPSASGSSTLAAARSAPDHPDTRNLGSQVSRNAMREDEKLLPLKQLQLHQDREKA